MCMCVCVGMCMCMYIFWSPIPHLERLELELVIQSWSSHISHVVTPDFYLNPLLFNFTNEWNSCIRKINMPFTLTMFSPSRACVQNKSRCSGDIVFVGSLYIYIYIYIYIWNYSAILSYLCTMKINAIYMKL